MVYIDFGHLKDNNLAKRYKRMIRSTPLAKPRDKIAYLAKELDYKKYMVNGKRVKKN